MQPLYARIRQAIRDERIVFSIHVDNQLRVRRIERWQMIGSFAEGKLIGAYPAARPNPKILVRQTLPNGEEVVAVWAFVASIRSAKLVTVYFEERR